MKTEAEVNKKEKKPVRVKSVIDKLISVMLPGSTKRGNIIFNSVCPELFMMIDENILALVIGNLLNDAITCTENDRLEVSSSEKGEIIVSSKKISLAKNHSFIMCVDALQVVAQRFGAPVSITGSYENGTVLSVHFEKIAA
jgi:signal transduction histidine kinase